VAEFVTQAKPLPDLMYRAGLVLPDDATNVEKISAITADSRQVRPGTIFVACDGKNVDGHRFIADALERGATAVVGTQPLRGLPVPYVHVDDSRQALARLAAAFYGHPGRRMTVIGVTGTDGKTTTTNLLFHILQQAGLQTGMISTVNAVIGEQVLDTGFHVTTPDATDVQRYLAMMVAAGMTHVILETTSHGLAQKRVDGCEFDVGVVTNITHEHLDYHGDYEAYRAAKGRLFMMLDETAKKEHGNKRIAVLNRDDQSYPYLHQVTSVRQVSYGLHEQADVRAKNCVADASGIRLEVVGAGRSFSVESPLVGEYNAANILAAATAAVWGLGVDVQAVQRGVAALAYIPGRMERIDMGQDFIAIVDFAHSPNALRVALEAVRPLTKGRVIAVFGSAGLRDQQKRRLMAQNSARLADLTVLTAEDPRTESLQVILEEMAEGARSQGGVEGKNYWCVPDRREAIRFALRLAEPGDVVISCGKGHEQSMCFGTREYLWDDRIAMRAALAEYLGVGGVEMPFLPDWD